jgi:hypothetical protein
VGPTSPVLGEGPPGDRGSLLDQVAKIRCYRPSQPYLDDYGF